MAVVGALSAGEVRILPLTKQQIALFNIALVGLLLPRRAVVGFGVETGIDMIEVIVEFLHVGGRESQLGCAQFVDGVAANLQVSAHQLLSMCHTILGGTVFRRPFVGANPRAVLHTRVFFEALHPEFGRTPHGGEGTFEVFFVECVAIVVPKVGAIPGIGHAVLRSPGRHAAEDAAFGEDGPSFRLSGALCGFAPGGRGGIVDDKIEERHVALAEIGLFGGPIVHLHIDIGVHIGIPRRMCAVVPDTLQVVGHMLCTAAGGNFEIASVVEIKFLEEESVGRVFVVLRSAIELHQVLGILFRRVGCDLEVHTSHERSEVCHVRIEEFVPRLGSRGVNDAFYAVGELGGVTGSAGRHRTVEARSATKEENHFGSAVHFDAIGRGAERTAHGNHLHQGVVIDGLEFTVERPGAVCGIRRIVGVQLVAGHEREAEMELIGALCRVARGHYAVGGGGKVTTGVERAVFVGKVHPADTLIDVEIAHIVEHFLVGRSVEGVGVEVFHEDATEIQEATEATVGAVAAARVDVVRTTGPERLFVELNFVVHHATEEAGAQRTVTDGEGVFHPGVRHAHSRFLVPQGVAAFGGESGDLGQRILPASVLRELLAIGRVGHRRLEGRIDEIERVVRVACVPESEFFARAGTAPLVDSLGFFVAFGDFVASVVSRAGDEGELDGFRLVGRRTDVRIVGRHRDVIALVRTEHKGIFIADQRESLSVFGEQGSAHRQSVAIVLQESLARLELDAHILGCGFRTEHGLQLLRARRHPSQGEENEK